jgi:predicted nucleotidyltransferase component of viral defense system
LSDKLILKGGTLLNKIHLNYHRLSEDLDFTFFNFIELNSRSKRSKAIDPIRKKMNNFLTSLNLESITPEGEGFNNSTHYIFNVLYPSVVTVENGNIKIEISLRQPPIDKPVHNSINHFGVVE